MYEIFTSEEFDNDFSKLDKSIREWIEKEIEQLEENPFVGKPLGYKFFREKKVGKHRIYYLIYEKEVVVFVVAISSKKDQQEVINAVRKLIPYYREKINKRFGSN